MRCTTYRPRQFNLSGLSGISDQTLETHFRLYEGYVRQTNTLNEKIDELTRSGKVANAAFADYSELTRRLGFEYNGMVLHELYFDNLKSGGGASGPERNSAFQKSAEASFSEFARWKTDFTTIGTMRGVGWVICYQDPRTGALSNHWIDLHETGNVCGFQPVLVMDVWEHAYLFDYRPSERSQYIEAFLSNVDWEAVDQRVQGVRLASTA